MNSITNSTPITTLSNSAKNLPENDSVATEQVESAARRVLDCKVTRLVKNPEKSDTEPSSTKQEPYPLRKIPAHRRDLFQLGIDIDAKDVRESSNIMDVLKV